MKSRVLSAIGRFRPLAHFHTTRRPGAHSAAPPQQPGDAVRQRMMLARQYRQWITALARQWTALAWQWTALAREPGRRIALSRRQRHWITLARDHRQRITLALYRRWTAQALHRSRWTTPALRWRRRTAPVRRYLVELGATVEYHLTSSHLSAEERSLRDVIDARQWRRLLEREQLRRWRPLVRLGVISGVVVAVVTFPLVATAGLTLKAGSHMIDGTPEPLRAVPPAQTSYLYASDGKTLLTQFYEEYRKYVPLKTMAPTIQQAIISAEDSRFFQHHGVDPKGVARAFVANNQAGGVSQGASTLTMQYIRMALRDAARTPEEVQAAVEQTNRRKLREIRMAVELERHMDKLDILEHYLNMAYFGHRAYGIYAASEVYFSKKPADLTVPEAAMLAGLVQAPSSYDPAAGDPQAATDRRNWVVDRMVQLKYLSPQAGSVAKNSPLGLKLSEPANDCVGATGENQINGFFCDLFKSWWAAQPAFGKTPGERMDRLRRGGYTIVSSIDPKIQASAEKHILEKEPLNSPYALGTVAIEPGTGRVKAMAVNRRYSLDQSDNGPNTNTALRGHVPSNYPNTVNALLGGVGNVNGYQAGSTFKMFTMLAALEKGVPLNTKIMSPQRYVTQYLSGPGEPASCGNRWCPSNANGAMTGVQTMWSGFGKSVNTFFVQLEQKVGAENAVRMAERLGLTWHTPIDKLQASPEKADGWGSFTLGVADTSPIEMADAYATVAAEGVYCRPLPVAAVLGLDGKRVTYRDDKGKSHDVADTDCHRAVDADVARGAIDAARCVTGYKASSGDCGDWSTAPTVYPTVKRPVAGKTGTTDNNRAAWFMGMTPTLAAASFMADPDNPFNVVGGGNSLKPIAVVAETFKDALAGTPVRDFTPPSLKVVGPPSPAPSPSRRSGDRDAPDRRAVPNDRGPANRGPADQPGGPAGNQVPGNQAPGNGVPDNRMPGNGAPGNQVPDGRAPGVQRPGAAGARAPDGRAPAGRQRGARDVIPDEDVLPADLAPQQRVPGAPRDPDGLSPDDLALD